MENELLNEKDTDYHQNTPFFNKNLPKGFTDPKQSVLSLESQRESFLRSPSNFDDHYNAYVKNKQRSNDDDKTENNHCNCELF
jgi:hypothetical protein